MKGKLWSFNKENENQVPPKKEGVLQLEGCYNQGEYGK